MEADGVAIKRAEFPFGRQCSRRSARAGSTTPIAARAADLRASGSREPALGSGDSRARSWAGDRRAGRFGDQDFPPISKARRLGSPKAPARVICSSRCESAPSVKPAGFKSFKELPRRSAAGPPPANSQICFESRDKAIQLVLRRSPVALVPFLNETKARQRNSRENDGFGREYHAVNGGRVRQVGLDISKINTESDRIWRLRAHVLFQIE